jgi:hypothetical protein
MGGIGLLDHLVEQLPVGLLKNGRRIMGTTKKKASAKKAKQQTSPRKKKAAKRKG